MSSCIHINIAKDTTDLRVEFIAQVLTQIFKFQFQILDYKALTSKSQPNISISTWNHDQTQLTKIQQIISQNTD